MFEESAQEPTPRKSWLDDLDISAVEKINFVRFVICVVWVDKTLEA